MTLKYFTDEMPLRSGVNQALRRQADELLKGNGDKPYAMPAVAMPDERLFEADGTRYLVPLARTPIVYPERKSQESRSWHPSLFDPWASGMPRLAMYQHQVSPDIHISKRPATEPELHDLSRTTLGQQQDLFKGWRAQYPDDLPESEVPPKLRRKLYAGKHAHDGERVTLPPGFWHVDATAKWSLAPEVCAIAGCTNGIPEGRRRYCSDEHAAIGRNAVRRAKRNRKWPTDERGWYIQSPQQPWRRPRWVHVSREQWGATRTKTLSGDCRLRLPWAGEPKVWEIRMTKVTCGNGRLAS
ncbi:hypothetical protein [Mycobacterium malmoense]|uniref:hypothetical protein n=1 Tax=Mycobacterium malmoense TaxID=1780 RepID=UPI001146EB07|nr:hypothetical protein [Mycobacterium malmoense]